MGAKTLDSFLEKVSVENGKLIQDEPEIQQANEHQTDAHLSAEDKKIKDAFIASNISLPTGKVDKGKEVSFTLKDIQIVRDNGKTTIIAIGTHHPEPDDYP